MHDKIVDFAKKQGFSGVKEIGKYEDYDVYIPTFLDNKNKKIGFPQYILVKDDVFLLKIDNTFELTKIFFPE